MEYSIATLLTGVFILSSAIFRSRKISRQKLLLQKLESLNNKESIDLSGKTQYVGCFAHQWVIDNVTRETPGKIRIWIREQLDASPIFAISLLALIASILSMSLVFLFFSSVSIIGGEVGIYFIGLLIIVGTGAPRISEELLDVLQNTKSELLTWRDFVYAHIARRTFIHSLIVTGFIGMVFIILSPWASTFVSLLAYCIVIFSDQVILLPAIAIAEYNMGLAVLYMTSVLPLFALSIVKLVQVIVQRYQGTGMFFFSNLN